VIAIPPALGTSGGEVGAEIVVAGEAVAAPGAEAAAERMQGEEEEEPGSGECS
jgi:hypothetical protein